MVFDRHSWAYAVVDNLLQKNNDGNRERGTGNRKPPRGGTTVIRPLSLVILQRQPNRRRNGERGTRELPKRQTAADGRESGGGEPAFVSARRNYGGQAGKGGASMSGVGPEHFGPPVATVYPPVVSPELPCYISPEPPKQHSIAAFHSCASSGTKKRKSAPAPVTSSAKAVSCHAPHRVRIDLPHC